MKLANSLDLIGCSNDVVVQTTTTQVSFTITLAYTDLSVTMAHKGYLWSFISILAIILTIISVIVRVACHMLTRRRSAPGGP
jgi:ABC-type arginine/histidine transport system permease subunit